LKKLTEDGVGGVDGDLVFGGVADEALGVGERHVGRRRPVPLVIGDDLNAVVLPHTDTRVGGAEIDTDRGALAFARHCSDLIRDRVDKN